MTGQKTRILGIDPGSRQTGYGVIDMQANHAKHVAHGVIDVKGDTQAQKLHLIFTGISRLITEFKPVEGAIERVFMHKNADSALKLGQARGAALVAMSDHELAIFGRAGQADRPAGGPREGEIPECGFRHRWAGRARRRIRRHNRWRRTFRQ